VTEPIITSGVIITFLGVLSLWGKILLNYMSRKRNHKKETGNPVGLDVFYQEFKDFKDTQHKWNDRIEGEIKELERMRRPGK